MDANRLEIIMEDQRESFLKEKNLIQRDIDLDYYIKTKQIVIITGIRRCGKSSLLYLIHKKIKKNFLYFNFDDERITNFQREDFNKLYELFLKKNEDKDFVFYFDEVQAVEGWEKFINRMHEKGIKIFVTGSNAKLLSSEIATTLTGRNTVLNLGVFSFKEFLISKKVEKKSNTTTKIALIKKMFDEYTEIGGFPLVVEQNDTEILKMYYNDIFYRDIISRHKITNIEEIKELSNFLISNTGKILSYSTLGKISNISSSSLIKKYLSFFFSSFLFFELKKFDYSVKKQILNPRKLYSCDQGLIKKISFQFSENKGRILENMVFIELKRRKKEIYYHKNKHECDFIIKEKQKIAEAIQVCHYLNEENKDREIKGIIEAMNKHELKKGLLLTHDEEDELIMENKEITIKPVWKWLLE